MSTPRVKTMRDPRPFPPGGCRWCGDMPREHGQRWVPGHGWHTHTTPTDAQRLARMRARRGEPTTGDRP